jgi:hypothetical protein
MKTARPLGADRRLGLTYFELEPLAEPEPDAPPDVEPAPALPEPMLEPVGREVEPEDALPLRFD